MAIKWTLVLGLILALALFLLSVEGNYYFIIIWIDNKVECIFYY